MKNDKIKYKNKYYFLDDEKLKIQLVKKITENKEKIKHIKITFDSENNVK